MLLALAALRPFASSFVIWNKQIDVADAECARELKQRHDRWIAPASFEAADILLSKAGDLGKALLGKPLRFPQLSEVSTDQLAHVHVRKLRLYIL